MFPAVSTPLAKRSHTFIAENLRRKQLAYIAAMTDSTGKSRTQLAREAGVSPSTISKFENDVDNIAQLEHMTMEKLAAVTGIPFSTWNGEIGFPVLREAEAEYIDDLPNDDFMARAVKIWRVGGNAIDPWVLRTRALELMGYLPGDVVLVDMNAIPRDGDVVCAQSYDRMGRAETVFRLYQKPFLTALSADRNFFRPLIVDEDRVQIRGVVVATLRPRAPALPN